MSATAPLLVPTAGVRSHRLVLALLVAVLAVAAAVAVFLLVGGGTGAETLPAMPGAGLFVEGCGSSAVVAAC